MTFDLITDICKAVHEQSESEPFYTTKLDGFGLLHDIRTKPIEAQVYEPIVCLVLQGKKETHIGDRLVQFGAGDSLIVSHSIPVLAAVTEASRQKPYVGLVFSLNLSILRGLYDEVGSAPAAPEMAQSLAASKATPDLIDAMTRLFRASQNAMDTQILAPMISREVHYRLLQADHGGMLRQMLWRDSPASRIARVIDVIRSGFRTSLPVSDLAQTAGMSVSAFHAHFKSVTAKSPLQYQKDLKLLEARRILSHGAVSVSQAAFDVGYESPTQFSREYSRKFGVSPRQDIGTQNAA
ncbi:MULTISPECIES: AraC family transcriptional regulator [unclassified Ruegeria]|uniref:AraC family transcriptional regulator n=1 Tax=unclassified Ruegeria TaxID=2625375 RepID=UPI001489432C|nr:MULTISPECIES: AraC family transcriptional regulator [unclassified Ruegeria]NOD47158.1 helix-turn-helix domain-containing protein [Ruegeria sp. HKCCD5849]NOD51481.1 helix-turn-helix domain-containing protein [Ruegeria sp. HKCCD5851]NOD69374.1 helix-turn-helix domain-containing protein [Ruegeria sp. HKCCD7303]